MAFASMCVGMYTIEAKNIVGVAKTFVNVRVSGHNVHVKIFYDLQTLKQNFELLSCSSPWTRTALPLTS